MALGPADAPVMHAMRRNDWSLVRRLGDRVSVLCREAARLRLCAI